MSQTIAVVPARSAENDETIDLSSFLIQREARVDEYKKNAVIFEEGPSENPRIYIIETGRVVKEFTTENGKKAAFKMLGSNQVIGLEVLDEGVYTSTARCLESTSTLSWSMEQVMSLRKKSSAFETVLAQQLFSDIKFLQNRIRQSTSATRVNQLSKFLVEIAQNFGNKNEGGTLTLPYTSHEELSHFLNTSREITSHLLNAMRTAGYITYGGRHPIQILDPIELVEWAKTVETSKV